MALIPSYDQVVNHGVDYQELDPFDILVGDAFWRHREPEHREACTARNAIIYAYEQGAIGATEAIGYLVEKELLGDADFFLSAFCQGVRALSAQIPAPPPPRIVCPYGDALCPCPDGDPCHYEGKDPWPAPARPAPSEGLLNALAPVRALAEIGGR